MTATAPLLGIALWTAVVQMTALAPKMPGTKTTFKGNCIW